MTVARDAARGVLGLQLAVREQARRDLAAKLHEVEPALLEQQEARDVLVDDVDLDRPDERDALALHAAHELGVLLAVALGEIRFAVIRVRLEDQPGAALPFLEPVRARCRRHACGYPARRPPRPRARRRRRSPAGRARSDSWAPSSGSAACSGRARAGPRSARRSRTCRSSWRPRRPGARRGSGR